MNIVGFDQDDWTAMLKPTGVCNTNAFDRHIAKLVDEKLYVLDTW